MLSGVRRTPSMLSGGDGAVGGMNFGNVSPRWGRVQHVRSRRSDCQPGNSPPVALCGHASSRSVNPPSLHEIARLRLQVSSLTMMVASLTSMCTNLTYRVGSTKLGKCATPICEDDGSVVRPPGRNLPESGTGPRGDPILGIPHRTRKYQRHFS